MRDSPQRAFGKVPVCGVKEVPLEAFLALLIAGVDEYGVVS
jgi:hypothetical protein